jgi:hypothetical protein
LLSPIAVTDASAFLIAAPLWAILIGTIPANVVE